MNSDSDTNMDEMERSTAHAHLWQTQQTSSTGPPTPDLSEHSDDRDEDRSARSRNAQRRTYHLIYVPDPTRRAANLMAAMKDLAFVKATLTHDEWDAVRSLRGYVFPTEDTGLAVEKARTVVYIQEWVRFNCLYHSK